MEEKTLPVPEIEIMNEERIIHSEELLENTSFVNNQILSDSLPKLQSIAFEPVQKSSLYVSIIALSLFFIILLVAATMVAFFVESIKPFYIYVILGILLLFMALLLFEWRGFKFRGFALRDHDVIFREGWLWRNTTVVPYNRVQHIEINQGPIDRLFDLSSINIFTAGGSSDLEIDGLLPDQAANIKQFIIDKANQQRSIDEEE